eukprot:6296832-Lingulodinium_polyedra.AAC.1
MGRVAEPGSNGSIGSWSAGPTCAFTSPRSMPSTTPRRPVPWRGGPCRRARAGTLTRIVWQAWPRTRVRACMLSTESSGR